MFEIERIEYINKTFRIPEKLFKKLEIISKENQISINRLVIQCCNYAMDNLENNISDL